MEFANGALRLFQKNMNALFTERIKYRRNGTHPLQVIRTLILLELVKRMHHSMMYIKDQV